MHLVKHGITATIFFSEEYEDKSTTEAIDDDDDDEADGPVQMYTYGRRSRSRCGDSNPGRVLDTAKIMERMFDLEGGRILLKVSKCQGGLILTQKMYFESVFENFFKNCFWHNDIE